MFLELDAIDGVCLVVCLVIFLHLLYFFACYLYDHQNFDKAHNLLAHCIDLEIEEAKE